MIFVFGYGSIINYGTRTVESLREDMAVRVSGLSRGWFQRIESLSTTSLGVVERDGASCNGVLVEVSPELLAELDNREEDYVRETLDHKNIELLTDGKLEDETTVYVYKTTHPEPATEEFPIVQSYVDMVLYGCLAHGEEFAEEFVKTTEFSDAPLIDDADKPKHPRRKPEYSNGAVKEFLKKHPIGRLV